MVFNENHVFLNEMFVDKQDVLGFIAEAAYRLDLVKDINATHQKFVEREREYSTGMVGGFAIPHCVSETVKVPSLLVIRCNEIADWEAMDEIPINFIIALIAPKDEGNNVHLQQLSNIASMLVEDEFRDELMGAKSEKEIVELISKGEN